MELIAELVRLFLVCCSLIIAWMLVRRLI